MKRCLSTSLALSLTLHLGVPTLALGAQDPEALKQQQMEYAKGQFQEGEALLANGDYKGAIKKYEIAYQYAPELHVLNYNIGVAAQQAGDCVKAKIGFQRFLDLVPDHPMREDAQLQLRELEAQGCASAPPKPGDPVAEEEDPLAAKTDEEDPLAAGEPTGPSEPDKPPKKKRAKGNPLVLGGWIGIGVGGALIVTGAITGIITRRNANKLSEMAQPGPTGFSPESYAEDEVFQLDQNRKVLGVATTIILPVGLAVAGAGVAMLLVGKKKDKQAGTAADDEDKPAEADEGKKEARRHRPRLTGFGAAATPTSVGVGASFSF